MVVGDPGEWTSRFRSFDIRLLECIASVWSDCLAVLTPQPIEDEITFNLVQKLRKDAVARKVFYSSDYQYEPPGYLETGMAYSKGKIDIAFFLDQNYDKYLAYECKRLNVLNAQGKRSSRAPEYVKEGVKRFVTEQYAEGLPVGCMLGYVMDGDIPYANTKIHDNLSKNKTEIKLRKGPIKTAPVSIIQRFTTWHQRNSGNHEIEVRHALLPFSSGN